MNHPKIKIQNRLIGLDYPPVVIAEIGINHGGALEEAKKIVDSAHNVGCEIIKHQTHIVEDEMSDEAKKIIPGNSNKSIYEIMERCALNEQDEMALKEYVESKGMIFISTPFSRAAANRLEKMNVSAYKIGSGECNNYPLIEYIAKFKKPMIVSTGMNNINSIKKTVDILNKYNVPFALLHCTNIYPTPPELVRLGGIEEMQNEFPNTIIGLSDHTTNNNACLASIVLGTCILERHYTDSMDRKGEDIVCSMDPPALKDLITGSQEIALMRGGDKEASSEEKVTIDFAFATVVAIKDIEKGDILTKTNTWVKRPGTGEIPAEEYTTVLGKLVLKRIKKNQHLKYSDLS